jgi:YVTN family beta-propeller protein
MRTGLKAGRRRTGQGWHLAGVGTLFVLSFLLGFALRDSSGVASTRTGPVFEDRDVRYLSPVAMTLSADGQRLYIVCEDSNLVLALDTRTGSVVARVRVGREPKGVAISPDGKTLYVTNEWDDSISEIDADTFRVRRTLHSGWGPVGITTDRTGKFLYVANTLGNNISVIDLATGSEIKRLEAGHFPECVALSRDGKHVFVSNLLVRVEPYDKPPLDELTVVDTAKQEISEHIPIPGVIQLRHVAELPAAAGGYLIIPFMRPKNLNPLIQVQQGWYMTHGIALVKPSAQDAPGQRRPSVAELLLDDVDQYFADGFGAATTPDGRLALVTASGANVVSIINTDKLNLLRRRVPPGKPEALANRLDAAGQFVVDRLKTGRNPTDVVVSPDGKLAYIANRTDDTVSVVDLQKLKIASTLDLGGPKVVTPVRRGAQVFFDASYCYQGQMACASCHPHEGLSDGLAWSLETPRLGRDVVENRTLLDIGETSPFKWNGHNVDLAMQDGPRTAMYIFRSQGFSASDVRDLVTYMESLHIPPNPRLAENAHLTDAQERGREVFFRTRTNTGALIPPQDRCYYCHAPATHYTSRVAMDVGTATEYDTIKEFDIPQLDGVYMRPPFLHNGEALTLEEIWTKFNPKDKHGITSDMDKVQLNDLIEYLKTF